MRPTAIFLCALATAVFAAMPSMALADAAVDRAALDSAIKAWVSASVARDADAMAAMLSEDFVLLPPNAPPVRGREAAYARWNRVPALAVATLSVTLEETVLAGDVAYSMGAYTERLPDGEVVRHGAYIDIWQRDGGEWRVHRRMVSDGRPARQKGVAPVPVPDQPMLDAPDPRP